MLHVTHENGETALYREREWVYVTDWMSDDGEYHNMEERGRAEEIIKPGVYVLDVVPSTDAEWPELLSRPVVISKVVSVRKVSGRL